MSFPTYGAEPVDGDYDGGDGEEYEEGYGEGEEEEDEEEGEGAPGSARAAMLARLDAMLVVPEGLLVPGADPSEAVEPAEPGQFEDA